MSVVGPLATYPGLNDSTPSPSPAPVSSSYLTSVVNSINSPGISMWWYVLIFFVIVFGIFIYLKTHRH